VSFRDEALNDTLALPIQTEAIVIEVVMHFGVHSSPVIAVILLIAFRRTCHPVVEVFQRNFVSSCVATERLSFNGSQAMLAPAIAHRQSPFQLSVSTGEDRDRGAAQAVALVLVLLLLLALVLLKASVSSSSSDQSALPPQKLRPPVPLFHCLPPFAIFQFCDLQINAFTKAQKSTRVWDSLKVRTDLKRFSLSLVNLV